MTSTPKMQRIAAMFCNAYHASSTGRSCQILTKEKQCFQGCEDEHGRPDCPFLAELLAAMTPVVGEEVTARWYNEGVKTGVKAAEKHANDLLAALTARVEALEKLIVNEEENRRDAVAHCEFRVEALEHHRHRCADGASWELTTEPTDWMPA